MSRQINFYADPEDSCALHAWLLREFPGLMAISADRGPKHQLIPIPAKSILDGDMKAYHGWGNHLFLVPQWALCAVVLRPLDQFIVDDVIHYGRRPPDQFIVDSVMSPIIEYLPSILDEMAHIVFRGRLYWCFQGDLAASESRQIDRMFRWVRDHTIPVPPSRRFRIFEHAARRGRMLSDGFGTPKISPPWKE